VGTGPPRPAWMRSVPRNHPSPLSSFFQFLSSRPLAEGDCFLTFPRQAGSESRGPHVGGRSERLAQTGCGLGRDSRVGRVWPWSDPAAWRGAGIGYRDWSCPCPGGWVEPVRDVWSLGAKPEAGSGRGGPARPGSKEPTPRFVSVLRGIAPERIAKNSVQVVTCVGWTRWRHLRTLCPSRV
jgi:hypothetical protein